MKKEFDIEKDLSLMMQYISNCCRKFLHDPDEASLLESEVLERIWKKRRLFKGSESDFRGWSYTIVRNLFITNYRAKKKVTMQDIDEHTNRFKVKDLFNDSNELRDILYTINKKFPKRKVDIFLKHTMEGYKIHELAKEFDIPDGTVKNITHTIRKYLSEPGNILSEISKR